MTFCDLIKLMFKTGLQKDQILCTKDLFLFICKPFPLTLIWVGFLGVRSEVRVDGGLPLTPHPPTLSKLC